MSGKTHNRQTLDNLFNSNKIDIRRGEIFDRSVQSMSDAFDFDRVEGMMLGLAIGDALGVTTESMFPEDRRERFGEIRDYIPNRYVNEPIGFPSDDTQLAFWTLDQMIADKSFIPENVAERFTEYRIYGLGSSVRQFLRNYKSGKKWYESGPKSSGNGALMRIAPMLIPHLKSGGTELWVDTALSAMLTHNDSASISSCISFINMLWHLMSMKSSPDSEWWPRTFIDIARQLEIRDDYTPRGGDIQYFKGFLWQFIEREVLSAYDKKLSITGACNAWYSGAYLLETVPSVIYILMMYGNNLEEAIVRAVNDTKDNDTIGAIVGAAVGALHGKSAIPERWIKNLSGRTTDRDEGKVFDILDKSAKAFWKDRS